MRRPTYRIDDRAPVVLAGEVGLRLAMALWSWKGPAGKPIFSLQSKGRSFAGSARCLIPADSFYEFTEPKVAGKETRWRSTLIGQPWFWIAGVVKEAPSPC